MVKKIFLLSIGAALCALCVNAAEQPIKPTLIIAWDIPVGGLRAEQLAPYTSFDKIVIQTVGQFFNLVSKSLSDISPADLKDAHYLIIVQSPSRTEGLRDVVARMERSVEGRKLTNFKNKAYVLIRQDPNSINIEPRIAGLFGGGIFQLYWTGDDISKNTDSYAKLEEFLRSLSPEEVGKITGKGTVAPSLEHAINEFYLKLYKQDISLPEEYLTIIDTIRNIIYRLQVRFPKETGIITPEVQQRINDYIGDLKTVDNSGKLAKQFSSIIEELKEQIAKLKKK